MTTLNDLDIPEPGEYNQLDDEPTYNPLRYCYSIPATAGNGKEYLVSIRFQLQMHDVPKIPIEITDQSGVTHEVPFFPTAQNDGVDPGVSQHVNPYAIIEYQPGENQYYLVPTIYKCIRAKDGKVIKRKKARKLLTPKVIATALKAYCQLISKDPDAPMGLHQLLLNYESGEVNDPVSPSRLIKYDPNVSARHCSICGSLGHDVRTCPHRVNYSGVENVSKPKDDKPAAPVVRRHICGICGQHGHNRRTCKDNK